MRLNLIVAAFAAAVLAAFVILYIVVAGNHRTETPENTLTLDQQTPRAQDQQTSDPDNNSGDSPQDAPKEETTETESQEAETAETETKTDSSAEAPSAPEPNAAKDPLSVELEEAVNELNQIAQALTSRFSSPPR